MLYVLVLDGFVQTFATYEAVLEWIEKAMVTDVNKPVPFRPSLGNGIRITSEHGRQMTRIKAEIEIPNDSLTASETVVREFRAHLAEIPKGCRGLPS